MRFLLLLSLLFSFSLVAQDGELTIARDHFGIDDNHKLIVCRADLAAENAAATAPFTSIKAGSSFSLVQTRTTLRYGRRYHVTDNVGEWFTLYFTQLPLVHINSSEWIPDDFKVPAEFIYADDEQTLTSTIGIERRGGFTQQLPKKTWDLDFWEDDSGEEESIDVSFAGMRNDDDWVLDAVYNEPLRVNAYVAHKLWLDIHQPYYLEDEPEAKSGADVAWCELFMDGEYRGLHFLSEQVDRKQLKLKKYKEENDEIRGELYKGILPLSGVLLRGVPRPSDNTTDTWDGFELKYPDTDDVINWDNLYDLIAFILNSSDATFAAEIGDWMHLGNVVDYFIFVNLAGARDNTGKNIYTARYDNDEPYFYAAWDLDGTFGNNWDGMDYPFTENILTNGLHRRLMENNVAGFNDLVCARYQELLASGLFLRDSLYARITTQHDYLLANGVYEREEIAWPGSADPTEDRLHYTLNWIRKRTQFLDDWTCDMTTSDEAPELTTPLAIFPNPTSGVIRLGRLPTELTDWEVTDLTGRRLVSGRLNGGTQEISIAAVPGGMYLLRVGRLVTRVVKIGGR
jgi:hypothetical protein